MSIMHLRETSFTDLCYQQDSAESCQHVVPCSDAHAKSANGLVAKGKCVIVPVVLQHCPCLCR